MYAACSARSLRHCKLNNSLQMRCVRMRCGATALPILKNPELTPHHMHQLCTAAPSNVKGRNTLSCRPPAMLCAPVGKPLLTWARLAQPRLPAAAAPARANTTACAHRRDCIGVTQAQCLRQWHVHEEMQRTVLHGAGLLVHARKQVMPVQIFKGSCSLAVQQTISTGIGQVDAHLPYTNQHSTTYIIIIAT